MMEKRKLAQPYWLLIFLLGFAHSGWASDPVIYFTYNFNFNLNFAECPVDSTPVMVEQGHIPLLDLFDKHKKWKADFFFTGYTSNYLQEHYPEVVQRIKKGLKKGKYHISTYTFTHPVLSLIPYDDVVRQLKAGLECDQKVWGIRPAGLFLPEVSWDVCLPQIMDEVGIEWVSIYKEIVPAYTNELVYPPTAYVEGINQTKAKVVLCTHSMDQGSTEELKRRLDSLYLALKEQNIDEFLVAFKDDAECLYFHSIDDNPGSIWGDRLQHLAEIERMDAKITMIENLPYARFMTMGEYIKRHPPEEMIYAENISGHANFDWWLRGEGRERLNVLENQARAEITNASYVIDLAEKLGMDVTESRQLLEKAQYQLLLAENSDGRGFVPHSSRKIFVATAAVKAKELAQQAAKAIKKK
ncbi:MAG: hypothetical protein ACETWG_06315 [Candidatus Neomarinimicrobiota bacterium]